MRYTLRLEAIADHHEDYRRRFERSHRPFDRRALDAYRYGGARLSPAVWRVVGADGACITTERVEGRKDYSAANTAGTRGIVFWYFLEPGIYEINERVSINHARRYFLRVTAHDRAAEITREQVIECLQSRNISA